MQTIFHDSLACKTILQSRSVLFCSIDRFQFLSRNQYYRIGWWSWVLIMRLTSHFYLSGQVRSWRNEQFMNVILPTLTDWFPYGKGISTPARSWIWRSVTVRLCHNMIKVLEAGYTDRDCTLEYVASDTRGSSLRSSWNSDETYNDSSNIDWREENYLCICSNIWWIINTRALPSKGHLAWCPAPNYDSRLALHSHTSNPIERPYNNYLQW